MGFYKSVCDFFTYCGFWKESEEARKARLFENALWYEIPRTVNGTFDESASLDALEALLKKCEFDVSNAWVFDDQQGLENINPLQYCLLNHNYTRPNLARFLLENGNRFNELFNAGTIPSVC